MGLATQSSAARLVVPLVVPTRAQLRAGALWVEFANWADALADHYGASIIVTADGVLSSDRVRDLAWSRGSESCNGNVQGQRLQHVRTFAKDVRSAFRGARFRWNIDGVEAAPA